MPTQAQAQAIASAPSPSARDLLESVSLYLHIPFCHAKCHYCDFNSYAGMLGLREQYVAALLREIQVAGERARMPDGRPRRCRTIFFGGGTPSLLPAGQVADLLAAARSALALDDDAEITLEANPGTLEYGHLDELRAVGVNRLSMGAQSFDAGLLKWMGRIHSPEEIAVAFRAARSAGFTSVNLDFIFALPGQSLAQWEQTLDRALDLGPEHLSLYSLIVEEGTPLFTWVKQGKVIPADDDLAADMYELASAKLAAAGYRQYEISNWALPGHECRHNLTYWRNLPYIGLGAGAHSWYAGHRFADVRPIREYIQRVRSAADGTQPAGEDAALLPLLPALAVADDEVITRELEMAETGILGLRLREGVSLKGFAARYGCAFLDIYGDRLRDTFTLGLLERDGDVVRLTEGGRLLGNEVFERLLPETDAAR